MKTPRPFASAQDAVPRKVLTGLAKLALALKSASWREAGPRALTPTQGQILAILNAKGDLRLGEVAADLGVKPATASVAVEALAEKGLVSKRWSHADSRALVIRLSAAGRREAKRVATWPDFLLDAVASLSEAEQEVFLKALIKMIRGLQERGEISTARMCVGCRFFRPSVHADPERPHHCAFVDAAFGDGQLRLDCADFEAAAPEEARENFLKWSNG